MFKWIAGFMDRCLVVVGAIVFAQVPLFMQQYTQQLIGRASELEFQVDAMRHAASLSNKTLEQLMQKFLASSDLDFARQGEFMQSTVGRWQTLSEALAAMQESTIWSRPFVFSYHLNSDVFSSTFHHFKMGLPLNIEGSIYALLGIIVGYCFFAFFRKILTFKSDDKKAKNNIAYPK